MTANPPACQKCGAALAPDVKFCESCGAPVSPPAVPAATVPVAAPVPPAPETPPATVQVTTPPAPAPVQEPARTEKAGVVPKEAGPKKPMSQTTMIIAGIIVLALLGAAVYFVGLPMLSGSGIPAPNQQPQATSGPGSSAGTPATMADMGQAGTVSLTAGPTDVPPTNRALIIDVERNAISHDITVTFQGGEGQYGVRELAITLTKSDGTVETKSLGHLERGSSITLKGTDKTDRVEITANFYNGESYKVVDQVFEYKKRVGSN